MSSVIAAARGAVAIGDLSVTAGVSSTHLAQQFKKLIGVTPKRLARTYRFTATVFAIDPAGPWRRLLRPGTPRPRVPGVNRAHDDPVRRSPAAVPARTSRPRAGADRCRPIDFLQERQLTTR
jgi:hypothetical protein